jgi:spore coat protein U-like protein
MAMHVLMTASQRLVFVAVVIVSLPCIPADITYTSTAGMPVTMEIVGSCVVTAADLNFGAYVSNSSVPSLAQTTLTLNCSTGTVEVSLDSGTGPGRNTRNRKMGQDSGIDRLDYDLYQDAGRTLHWGDKSGTDTRDVLTTGQPQTVNVYGQIPAGQRVREGNYSDTITVSVFF